MRNNACSYVHTVCRICVCVWGGRGRERENERERQTDRERTTIYKILISTKLNFHRTFGNLTTA